MHDNIPELRIEPMDEGSPLLLLEQDGGGNVDRIAIHPVHVRYLAERMGLASSGDLDSDRTIARLSRQMQALSARINCLAARLDTGEPTFEQAYARATADLAQEFCTELPPLIDAMAEAAREVSK